MVDKKDHELDNEEFLPAVDGKDSEFEIENEEWGKEAEESEETEDAESEEESSKSKPVKNEKDSIKKSMVLFSCPRCYKVFDGKKWTKDYIVDIFTNTTDLAYCEDCAGKDPSYFVGSIEIYDRKLEERKKQMIDLVKSCEKNFEEKKPFDKILAITETKESLFITINTARMALEIGRSLRREFQGGIQYEWFERNRFLRVKWFDKIKNRDYYKERIYAYKHRRRGLYSMEDED
jgi:hypothetical protein